MLLIATALTLGFVHGLGADHLMAIAALAVAHDRGAPGRTFGVALRFAIGHALLLAAGASAVLLLGWNFPVLLERAGEVLGGAILVGLGGVGLWVAFTKRIYAHTHGRALSEDKGDPVHSYWHVHFGRREHHPRPFGHAQVPGLVGAVFAVSGLRALTMMTPFGDQSLVTLLPLIGVFAIGILFAMTLFGIILARALGSAGTARIGRAAGALTSAASVMLGAYWVLS